MTSVSLREADRSEKARGHNPDTHVTGESHSSIVPKKPATKGGAVLPAESVEGRGLTKENTEQSLLDRTQSRNSDGKPLVARSRGLLGVRKAARRDKKQKFTSLLHHITADLLRASFLELKKQAAPGVELRTLRRRSQRGRRLTWEKFSKLSKRWLPTPTILHPYPNVRFACHHPR